MSKQQIEILVKKKGKEVLQRMEALPSEVDAGGFTTSDKESEKVAKDVVRRVISMARTQ